MTPQVKDEPTTLVVFFWKPEKFLSNLHMTLPGKGATYPCLGLFATTCTDLVKLARFGPQKVTFRKGHGTQLFLWKICRLVKYDSVWPQKLLVLKKFHDIKTPPR